jgi:hypothetical protein
MMPDDDAYLSAYLDGQLGPDEQQAVEAALLDDPRLAEELRDLGAVRDLLAGLPRESPGDLTSRVMRRVRRRAMLGTARGLIARGPARAAGLVAIAAAVLMMVAASWFLHGHRGPAVAPAAGLAASRPPAEKPRPILSDTQWPSFASHASPERPVGAARPEERPPSPAEPAADEASGQNEFVHVRKYLDHPNLRRVFLVSDPGDGSDERQVANVVEQTTHYNYYKITISQGIVIDPRHPEQATVFALVVDPRELDSLRDRLHVALKDRVEEEAAEPGAVTQLAHIDRVEACPPVPAVDIPREAFALRVGDAGAPGEAPRADQGESAEGPTRFQEYSAPIAELLARKKPAGSGPGRSPRASGGQRPVGGPARPEDADQTLVVLVWVSRPRPG